METSNILLQGAAPRNWHPDANSFDAFVGKKLKVERKSHTLDFPFQPSRRWQQFFIKHKLTHLCFHCLRVTYINRLRRAGVPREAAMRLVNHASALVHEVYQREKVDDVMQWRDAIKFPTSKTPMVLAA